MRRIAVALFAALVVAAPLRAQSAHPDFSGKWNLDVSKIEGPMAQAGITAGSMTITQTAKAIKEEQAITSAQVGAQTTTTNYNLDGTESKNTVTMGPQSLDLTSTSAWDGTTLVITTKGSIQGNDYVRTDRYNLDPTGKILTVDAAIDVMGQSLTFKETFNKAS